MSERRRQMKKSVREHELIQKGKPDLKKIHRSLEKEIEREKPTTFWGRIKNLWQPTRAEKKMKLFLLMYPRWSE